MGLNLCFRPGECADLFGQALKIINNSTFTFDSLRRRKELVSPYYVQYVIGALCGLLHILTHESETSNTISLYAGGRALRPRADQREPCVRKGSRLIHSKLPVMFLVQKFVSDTYRTVSEN